MFQSHSPSANSSSSSRQMNSAQGSNNNNRRQNASQMGPSDRDRNADRGHSKLSHYRRVGSFSRMLLAFIQILIANYSWDSSFTFFFSITLSNWVIFPNSHHFKKKLIISMFAEWQRRAGGVGFELCRWERRGRRLANAGTRRQWHRWFWRG